MSVSTRKRQANRRNAAKSTRPRTEQGKKTSSRNAATHRLFCDDLLQPGEDEPMFHALRNDLIVRFSPQNSMELMLVERIFSAMWRLIRVGYAEGCLHRTRGEELQELAEEEVEELMDKLRHLDDDEMPRQRARMEALRLSSDGTIPAAATLAASFNPGAPGRDGCFERLSRYEQRLEGMYRRAIRDLENLRKSEVLKPTKLSPFATNWMGEEPANGESPDDSAGAGEEVQNEPTKTADKAQVDSGSEVAERCAVEFFTPSEVPNAPFADRDPSERRNGPDEGAQQAP